MDIVTTDVESFWDRDYSLSRLSPLEYVMGDRFELQFLSLKVNRERSEVFVGPDEIAYACRQINWTRVMALGHNMSGFDAYVLAYRLGIKPRMWGCTMAMARPIHAKTVGLSLAALVKFYGLGAKNNAALLQTKGRYLADFSKAEVEAMRVYNADDTDQCRGVFDRLLPHYSARELWQIDALTRMRTEPKFELDALLLADSARVEAERKTRALLDLANKLGIRKAPHEPDDCLVESVRSELASAPKFSALLQERGVEVPMKSSPTNPEKRVPALAKTDEAFKELLDHHDPLVAAAAAARLDVKSTLLETRIAKFLTAAKHAGGRVPIPLKYCGADTTGRDSGEEYNPQNLPRVDPRNPKPHDALRYGLRAPKGYKVIVADQSGIELRVNHFLWKVPSSMELYRNSPDKADLYKDFAAKSLFKCEVEAVTKNQRQVGKVAQLGLGFGAGAETFRTVARTMGGVILPVTREDDPDAEITCEETVTAWRSEYQQIVGGWKACARAVIDINNGTEAEVDPWGLVTTCSEGFRLPSGRIIRYPHLQLREDGRWPDGRTRRSWFYGLGRHEARITGPKADENIVQALARDSIFDCAYEFYKTTSLRPALRVHDELVYVVPESEATSLLAELQRILRTPPTWWPELVVWSEGDSADSYGAAK